MAKLGSLFDGSGGFPLAGSLCGIEPVWAAEVEPYPIAVTTSRFPKMKHLGDVSKVNGAEIEPVDIITFGSPCQDLSVAGKRAGLKHTENGDEETTRSGLFMEAVRIIKEMRKATNGVYPTFAIWENVPGAFSSNRGEDFRIVLEELIKICEPSAVMPAVPKGGWAYADSYIGDGWSLAYRVFDAQYIRTAQRRRRIYLVLHLTGECAREVLFERESLRGHLAESRTQGQAITPDAERGSVADDREGNCVSFQWQAGAEASLCIGDEVGPSLSCTRVPSVAIPYTLEPVICLQGNGIDRADTAGCNGKGWTEDVCYTLNTIDRPAVAVKCYDIGEARLRTPSEYVEVTPTITARCGTGGNNVPAVVVEDGAKGEDGAVYSMKSIARNGVPLVEQANPICASDYKDHDIVAYLASGKETAGTLMASMATKQCLGDQEAFSGDYHIIEQRCYRQGGFGEYVEDEAGPLRASGGDYGGGSESIVVDRKVRYIVRRLTPTECARLQGFPDLWGHPDKKDSLTDEEYRFWLEVRNTHAAINGKAVKDYTREQMLKWYNGLHSDSNEYKMWGNGIALPCALYVMQGIEDVLNRRAK